MICEFWQKNLEVFLELLKKHNFSTQEIGRYRSMAKRLIENEKCGTWNSYDDAEKYYKERTDLCEKTRYKYYTVINKLKEYHFNNSVPCCMARKEHISESDASKGELNLMASYGQIDRFILDYRNQGYSDSVVTKDHCIIKRIVLLSKDIEWNTFSEIKDWYGKQGLSQKYLYDVYAALDKYEHWFKYGVFPSRTGIQPQLKCIKPSIGELDLTYLQSKMDELISYMKEHGYSYDYIRKIKFIASRIIVLSRTIKWDSYEDIWKWYQNGSHKKGYINDVRRVLGLLENYHLNGLFPRNREVQNPLCPRKSAYLNLNSEFKEIVDYGCQIEEMRGLKPSTIRKKRSEISLLLYSLQIIGENALSKISEEGVISFFYKNGVFLHDHSTASSIAAFLKNAINYEPNECRRILSYIPKIRKRRLNIQYLTESECNAFCYALEDTRNDLSFKNRAIGTLLYYTGMRCSDICNLKLDSVDLHQSVINFIQQKTGNEAKIPLTAIVGNAIIDYCINERPETESPYLFVTDRAPYRRLIKGAVQWAVIKIMDAACIRQNKGDRKGSHIFRHRVVSRMAEKNVPAPVISAVVGHSNPKSLDAYMYADMKHLRECALGLEKYPISEEVFSYV